MKDLKIPLTKEKLKDILDVLGISSIEFIHKPRIDDLLGRVLVKIGHDAASKEVVYPVEMIKFPRFSMKVILAPPLSSIRI